MHDGIEGITSCIATSIPIFDNNDKCNADMKENYGEKCTWKSSRSRRLAELLAINLLISPPNQSARCTFVRFNTLTLG